MSPIFPTNAFLFSTGTTSYVSIQQESWNGGTINGNRYCRSAWLLRAGVVANTESELKGEELTIKNTRFESYNSTTCRNYLSFKYTFTKGNISEDEIWCVRAYVQYTDDDGNKFETYGDTVRADKNGKINEV